MIDKNTQETFWSQVVKPRGRGCWLWDGPMGNNGHGYFMYQRQTVGAYRMAYLITYGDIPSGLIICHYCNENQCVNPKHLYAGTQADNGRDRRETGQRWLPYKRMTVEEYNKSISPRKAQTILGIGAVELRMLHDSGALAAWRTGVGTWAYKPEEVEAYAALRCDEP